MINTKKIHISLYLLFTGFYAILHAQLELPKVPADIPGYYKAIEKNIKDRLSYSSALKYSIRNGAVTTTKYKEYMIKYGTSGKPMEIEYYNPQGIIKSIHTYKYNSKSMPEEIIKYNPKGIITGTTEFSYAENGCLKQKTELNNLGDIISKEVYTTDTDKNTLNCIFHPGVDSLQYSLHYIYNHVDTGKIIEHYKYGSKGNLIYRAKVEYDEKGNKTGYYYGEDSTVTYKLVYNTDHLGNLSGVTRVLPSDNSLPKFMYDYDGNGNRTGLIEYGKMGEILRYYKYQYVYKK